MYSEDDMLMLSGIQHFRFCPRQWALIHLERLWEENILTTEGKILHKHVDDPFYRQKCGANIVLRSVSIASHQLGLYGKSDVIELQPADDDCPNSITHPKYPERWIPVPIEYKHGSPKRNEIDEVQLVAQAMCLEEMYSIKISHGAFYYAKTRHREEVEITNRLRELVNTCAQQMHNIYKERTLPKSNVKTSCKKCSLYNLCMPELEKCATVRYYLKQNLF